MCILLNWKLAEREREREREREGERERRGGGIYIINNDLYSNDFKLEINNCFGIITAFWLLRYKVIFYIRTPKKDAFIIRNAL